MKSDKLRVFYSFALFGKEEQEAVANVLKNHIIVGGDKKWVLENKIEKLSGKKRGPRVKLSSLTNLILLSLFKLLFAPEILRSGQCSVKYLQETYSLTFIFPLRQYCHSKRI